MQNLVRNLSWFAEDSADLLFIEWTRMNHCSLIVQTVSYAHIKNVVHFVHRALKSNLDPAAELIICDEIHDVKPARDRMFFVIGENFARHVRQPDCYYVYLNFSVVSVLGNPLKMSRIGWAGIRRKRRMLMERLNLYDAVLDYFPPQTDRLARTLDLPVLGFPVAVEKQNGHKSIPLQDRPYDICFVGNMTPRREEVIEQLKARGFSFSPSNGVVFEDMAAQSRCCLNVHAYRSNHLETPRIVGALATETPVLTEASYGLETLLPDTVGISAPTKRLINAAEEALRNPEALKDLQARATAWFDEIYLPKCEEEWAKLCGRLVHLSQQKEAFAPEQTIEEHGLSEVAAMLKARIQSRTK